MKTKIERDNEIRIAYSYITLAKIAIVESGEADTAEMKNIIDRISDLQVHLAPMTVKKVDKPWHLYDEIREVI